MGMFIKVKVKEDCNVSKGCKKCVDICPVDIFALDGKKIRVVEENEDECTLCELCLKACPSNAITIKKLYEE